MKILVQVMNITQSFLSISAIRAFPVDALHLSVSYPRPLRLTLFHPSIRSYNILFAGFIYNNNNNNNNNNN